MLFRERNYAEALRYLQEAVKFDSSSLEIHYLLGVSNLWVGKYDLAIKELSNLLDKQAFYHKNVFLLLSIAYKKVNRIADGIKTVHKEFILS